MIMPEFKYSLGCRKDTADPRDLRLTRLPPSLRVKLPSKVDYTARMSPVSDQGDELRTSCGKCVRP
jgi:hypothetical protein